MKEESQIEDMRAALRGDRERADQARQSLENVLALTETPEPAAKEQEPPPRQSVLGSLFRRR